MSDFSKNKPPAASSLSNLSQSKSAYLRSTNLNDQSFSNRPENHTIHLNPFQRGKKHIITWLLYRVWWETHKEGTARQWTI